MTVLKPNYSAVPVQTDAENQARAIDLIPVDEARRFTGLFDDPSHDTDLEEQIIPAALGIVESNLERAVTALNRIDFYSGFSSCMLLGEVLNGDTITLEYIDSEGATQTVASGDYTIDKSATPTAVFFNDSFAESPSLYTKARNPVSITYEGGAVLAPEGKYAVREAFKRLIIDLYNTGVPREETLVFIDRILQPYSDNIGV